MILCVDNEQSVVPECVVGDFPEQQHGEGCSNCNQCSGGDEGNMEDFEEFQDYDEF